MKKDPGFINFVRRGWIEVGGARMSLIDIKGGFYGLREVLASEVGDTEDDLVCEAGIQGSTSFMVSAMESGRLAANEDGFRGAVDTYSDAGFGNFEIAELFWSRGWAIVRCNDSFEGWAYVENRNVQNRPKCDYTRGVLMCFMSETHRQAKTGVDDISVVESKCIGKGDEECEFLIGTRNDLQAYGYEVAPPRISVREKLERTISLLRDSNKRLMRAEMQYRSLFDVTLDAILIVDREFRVLECNRLAEEFLEVKRPAMVGKKLFEYLPSVSDASLEEKVRDALRLNTGIDFKTNVRTARGESRLCQVRVSPVHGEVAVVFHRAKEDIHE